MNPTTRFLIVFACLVVAALEAPRAAAVLTEDVSGPYAACGSAPLAAGSQEIRADGSMLAAASSTTQAVSFASAREISDDPSEHDSTRDASAR